MSGMLMMALESWCFEFSTLLAARLGEIPLDAHTVLLNVAGFTFLVFPFGIAVAATVRVGNLLGEGDATRAAAAAAAALLLGSAAMLASSLLIALGASEIGRVFTSEAAVVAQVAALAPICAMFQLVDGLQGTSAGVLRGMGRQATVAAANIGGFWVAGLPVGAALTFAAGLGVAGLWWGLLSGLTVSSATFLWVLTRVDWEHECKAAAKRVGQGSAGQDEETAGLVDSGAEADAEAFRDGGDVELVIAA